MSERSEVWLKDRQTGQLVPATLIDRLSRPEVEQAQQAWAPHVKRRLEELMQAGAPVEDWPQHARWNWAEKAKIAEGILAYQFLGIECDGDMQGLMLVALEGYPAQIPAQAGKPLVHIKFLETAPWNLRSFTNAPRYGGVGSVLMAAAIQLSIDNEFQGRIGLYALPQAESFYVQCGMTQTDHDAGPGRLKYYEMAPEQAQSYLTVFLEGRT